MKNINTQQLPFNITKHGNVSGVYFNNILENVIKLIYYKKKIKVLDFGCGYGYLKKTLKTNKNVKVIGYDIVKQLSDINDWKKIKFDYFISTQVFVYFTKKKLNQLVIYLKKNYPNVKVIITISNQGWLNKLGAYILNEPEAHTNFRLTPDQEIKIFKKHMKIIKKKNILFLSKMYLLKF